MVSSFAVSVLLLILHKNHVILNAHFHGGTVSLDLPLTVAVTTLCWVLIAFLGPQTDPQTLIAFYRKVKPFGPGWRRIRLAAGVSRGRGRRHPREHSPGAARLGGRLHGHLVGALHRGQLPLWPHGHGLAAAGRVHRRRPGPDLCHQQALVRPALGGRSRGQRNNLGAPCALKSALIPPWAPSPRSEAGLIAWSCVTTCWRAGTTPSAGCIKVARRGLKIGLQVIVRPRGGDFLYSEEEMQVMREDVVTARELGADGVVIGCLTAAGDIDRARTGELIELARPLNVTFHRAFDMCRDPREALEVLIGLGVERASDLRPGGFMPGGPRPDRRPS